MGRSIIRSAMIVTLVILVWIGIHLTEAAPSSSSSSSFRNNNKNAYSILGVTQEASEQDIKKAYRRLCLKYHPDKNTHRPHPQRNTYEQTFKTIQEAYSLIGEASARRQYDDENNNNNDNNNNMFASSQYYNPFFFTSTATATATARAAAHDLFGRRRHYNNININNNLYPLRSIYKQRVQIPLEDLYTGKSKVQFQLRENLWTRCVASMRGKSGIFLLYQSFLYTLPFFKLLKCYKWWCTMALGLFWFQFHLPKVNLHQDPTLLIFEANLRPGYKTGTKLIYGDNNNNNSSNNNLPAGVTVIFELVEKAHPTYQRIGNDLHVQHVICPSNQTTTTTNNNTTMMMMIEIEPLSKDEEPIRIELEAGQMIKSGQTITIHGKGWPNRKTNQKGDLIVHLRIQRRQKQQWHMSFGSWKMPFWR